MLFQRFYCWQSFLVVILLFFGEIHSSTDRKIMRKKRWASNTGDGSSMFRGTAGVDYPDLKTIPTTSFSCTDKIYEGGLYADVEAYCQVYHVCHDGRKNSFLCGKGTIFNQQILACDYWYSTECENAPNYYHVNSQIGQANSGNLHSSNGYQGSENQQEQQVNSHQTGYQDWTNSQNPNYDVSQQRNLGQQANSHQTSYKDWTNDHNPSHKDSQRNVGQQANSHRTGYQDQTNAQIPNYDNSQRNSGQQGQTNSHQTGYQDQTYAPNPSYDNSQQHNFATGQDTARVNSNSHFQSLNRGSGYGQANNGVRQDSIPNYQVPQNEANYGISPENGNGRVQTSCQCIQGSNKTPWSFPMGAMVGGNTDK